MCGASGGVQAVGRGSRRDPRGPSLEAKKIDAPGAGLREHSGLVQNENLPGLQCGGVQVGIAHGLEGASAEAGNVEAPILFGFDGFNKEGVVSLERAGAAEHLVGAFEGLDREDCAFANDAALANVEASGFPGDVDTVIKILTFDRKGLSGHAAG